MRDNLTNFQLFQNNIANDRNCNDNDLNKFILYQKTYLLGSLQ